MIRLADARIALFGLGLMGGSLAMALHGHCKGLFAVDPDFEVVALARQLAIVDAAFTEPSEFISQANLLILAAPVHIILDLLSKLPDIHPGPAIVLDLGSTKKDIVDAMQKLPAHFDPIGGHPMCGKEKSSLSNATPDLYLNAPFAFTPLKRTSADARSLMEQLATRVRAKLIWLDPETHDRWTAATSHLPYLLSNVLAAATPAEAASMIGTGFLSTTRLAVTPLSIMQDILDTNQANILEALHRFRDRLDIVEQLLATHDLQSLSNVLEEGSEQYRRLIE
jgi:prephenate dehydrogenase